MGWPESIKGSPWVVFKRGSPDVHPTNMLNKRVHNNKAVNFLSEDEFQSVFPDRSVKNIKSEK